MIWWQRGSDRGSRQGNRTTEDYFKIKLSRISCRISYLNFNLYDDIHILFVMNHAP